MAISDREMFTFTWQIEHFSFCPQTIGEAIKSPTFVVNFLKGEWDLKLYPRGHSRNENYIQCFLGRKKCPPEKIAIDFSITILSFSGKGIKRNFENTVFEKPDKNLGTSNLCTREDIINIANGYLPNDTLTLKCEIWKIEDGKNDGDLLSVDVVPVCAFGALDSLNPKHTIYAEGGIPEVQTDFFCDECMSVTHINVLRKSVVWSIKELSEFHPNKKLFPTVVTVEKETPSFLLTLYLIGENVAKQRLRIEIKRMSRGSEKSYFVKCKISVLNAVKKIRFLKEDEHFFDDNSKNDVWIFPEFTDLQEEKSRTSRDIVYLRCEFAFTSHSSVDPVEKRDVELSNLFLGNDSVMSIFKEMYNDEKFCDVVLRSGDREFDTHKFILAAHSPVFKAMFQNDMMEKQNGVVNITDIGDKTLSSMLAFLYGDELKMTEFVDAMDLYFAADKYAIQPLKRFCSCFIRSGLSISNVVSVLTFADLHQDDELKNEAENFVRFNLAKVFDSGIWAEFMRSHGKLAGDIMFKLLKDSK